MRKVRGFLTVPFDAAPDIRADSRSETPDALFAKTPQFAALSDQNFPTTLHHKIRIEIERNGRPAGLIYSGLVSLSDFLKYDFVALLKTEQDKRDFWDRYLADLDRFYEQLFTIRAELSDQKEKVERETDHVNAMINYLERNDGDKETIGELTTYRNTLRDYFAELVRFEEDATETNTPSGLETLSKTISVAHTVFQKTRSAAITSINAAIRAAPVVAHLAEASVAALGNAFGSVLRLIL